MIIPKITQTTKTQGNMILVLVSLKLLSLASPASTSFNFRVFSKLHADIGTGGPVLPVELEVDMNTGMKNYIANESGKLHFSTSTIIKEAC